MKTPSIFGQHDEATLEQLNQVGETARFTALMADGHRGSSCPLAEWRRTRIRSAC